MADEENTLNIWEQYPEEPDDFYHWFHDYYLPLGFMRSINKAYAEFVVKEEPSSAIRLNDPARRWHEPNVWSQAASQWGWLKRGLAYDAQMIDEAVKSVKQAQLNLRLSTVRAVETLISNLDSPRNGVMAAKEILDRGGIPAHSTSDVVTTVNISSDEMAEATAEVEAWEKKMLDGNG
jgi:hypothetical protein